MVKEEVKEGVACKVRILWSIVERCGAVWVIVSVCPWVEVTFIVPEVFRREDMKHFEDHCTVCALVMTAFEREGNNGNFSLKERGNERGKL